MNGQEFALKGNVSEGLFSSEAVVSFRDARGQEVSLVAPAVTILKGPHGGLIRIRILQRDGHLYLVRLPGEVYGAGSDVTVTEDQLQKV
jgi:hypothetical protein